MPRLPRVYVEGAVYYITCKGAYNERLFGDEKDYMMYQELLKKYRDEHGFKLYAYCLMPQHLHLLIEPSPAAEISEIMRSLNTAYPKYFNNRYQRRGHLFRERFKACLIEKDSYLADVISHIHRNPIRLNLAASAQEYPYSSAGLYINDSELYPEMREVRGLFADSSGFMTPTRTDHAELDFHKRLQRGGILGSKDFAKRVRKAIQEAQTASEVQIPVRKRYFPLIAVATTLVVFTAAVTAFFVAKKIRTQAPLVQPVAPQPEVKTQPALPEMLKALDNSQWQIILRSVDGQSAEMNDSIYFREGKMTSEKFLKTGFKPTDYSIKQYKDKIVWETIQAYRGTMASWRGEVRGEAMRGMLSLQSPDGSRQDFSFISNDYRRQ